MKVYKGTHPLSPKNKTGGKNPACHSYLTIYKISITSLLPVHQSLRQLHRQQQ